MLFIIEIIAGLFLLGVVAVAVFIMMQPKHRFVFDVKNRTKAELTDKTDNKLCFSIDVPFTNEGGDEGLVLDAFMRIYLPQEQYDKALVRGKINLKDVPRDDDYFEALVMPKGANKTMTAKFELTPMHSAGLKEAVNGLPDFDVAMFWECRGRENLYTVKKFITISADEVKALLK